MAMRDLDVTASLKMMMRMDTIGVRQTAVSRVSLATETPPVSADKASGCTSVCNV